MKNVIRHQTLPAFLLRSILWPMFGSLLVACSGGDGGSDGDKTAPEQAPPFASRAALGESLFADTNLSMNRSQSCATCHNPEHAFIDNRLDTDGHIGAVSVGDDGASMGDRNTPTAAYAAFAPEFHQGTQPRINSTQPDYTGFIGGQFLDGREADLQGQASGPPLNPVEMNMPDKASVVARLMENSDYVASFQALYGSAIFDDVDAAYAAMTDSIAEFERSPAFASFDSKYDRSLKGDYTFNPLAKATLGKSLFFSQQFTNCATCHQLKTNNSKTETFTSFEYHNIGVPKNTDVRASNGKGEDFVDNGLLDHPDIVDPAEAGKFKVPTLRNVAVTAPYMHNGVFRELRTVILFYDHFHQDSPNTLNPETGEAWRDAEVTETVNVSELQVGPILTDDDVDALVCFLMTLTDARYEHLLNDSEIEGCGI